MIVQIQMLEEEQKWPYDFPLSADFPRPNQRGSVRGRLMVQDKYVDSKPTAAKSAYVVLAPPGEVGSWQDNFKVASSHLDQQFVGFVSFVI